MFYYGLALGFLAFSLFVQLSKNPEIQRRFGRSKYVLLILGIVFLVLGMTQNSHQ